MWQYATRVAHKPRFSHKIQNDEVPGLLAYQFDCLVRRARLTKDYRSRLLIEHPLDPVSDDGMVIHDKDFRPGSAPFAALGYAGGKRQGTGRDRCS